ncbi:MAG TPA: SRPBCC family protein [Nocardioidaceae bacterium]|nr:SRPBCC family protein [Nocardioidaceae bacterium]
MKLANSFSIARPPGEVYDAFLDIERVATCMPGSRMLGQPEPGTYEGEVKVKVGPLGVAYTGQFTVLEADRDSLRLTMRAKGREQRGAGNADAHIVAQLSEQDGGTLVEIDTDLSIRGKVAQFGRGVIGEVTDGIMATFASNVEAMLTGSGPSADSSATEPTRSGQPARTGQPAEASAGDGASAASGGGPAPAFAGAAGADGAAGAENSLDGWSLVVRPMLLKHAGSLVTIAVSTVGAYLGARAGARAGSRAGSQARPRRSAYRH